MNTFRRRRRRRKMRRRRRFAILRVSLALSL
jgi:hypothetical protein